MGTIKYIVQGKRFFLPMLLVVITLSSCLKSKDNYTEPPAASLMLVNASSGVPDMDFYLNRSLVNNSGSIEYPSATNYFQLYQGNWEVAVAKYGGNVALSAGTAVFVGGKYYTVFAARKSATSTDSVALFASTDDLTAPPSGKAKIRFINLTPDAPAMDVAVKDSTTVLTGQAFGKMSDFITVSPKDAFVLELHEAGNSNVKLTTSSFTVRADKIYTVYSHGLWNVSSGDTAFNVSSINN